MKKFLIILLIASLNFSCAKKTDPDTITVWHWMTDRSQALEELASRYKEETGITVKIDLYAPSDIYAEKITASAQAKTLPDVFGVLDRKIVFASYIKNGFIAELTGAFKANNEQWKKIFFKSALDVNRFTENNSYGVKPGIYGVPIDMTNIQMLYNKKLLAKAGYKELPKTFKEFLEIGGTLKKIGITGFVSGWGEPWLTECFALNYAFNIMGEEKVMATYRGEVPYTDADWIKVFDIFRQLRDSGVLIDGIVTKGNKFAEQDFALERAVFAFNGSWCVNVYGKMNPALEYAPMIPPGINQERPMSIWGGAGSSFVVNEHSINKDKAIAFLKWLTDEKQQVFLSKETKNLPANKKAILSIDPILSEFTRANENITHPTIWEVNEDARVSERFTKAIQSILIGDKTPQEAAQDVQALKEQVMQREKTRNK